MKLAADAPRIAANSATRALALKFWGSAAAPIRIPTLPPSGVGETVPVVPPTSVSIMPKAAEPASRGGTVLTEPPRGDAEPTRSAEGRSTRLDRFAPSTVQLIDVESLA
jgi:hypothetical protein